MKYVVLYTVLSAALIINQSGAAAAAKANVGLLLSPAERLALERIIADPTITLPVDSSITAEQKKIVDTFMKLKNDSWSVKRVRLFLSQHKN